MANLTRDKINGYICLLFLIFPLWPGGLSSVFLEPSSPLLQIIPVLSYMGIQAVLGFGLLLQIHLNLYGCLESQKRSLELRVLAYFLLIIFIVLPIAFDFTSLWIKLVIVGISTIASLAIGAYIRKLTGRVEMYIIMTYIGVLTCMYLGFI